MDEKKILQKLQRLCSKAEYCTRDMYRKALTSAEGDEEMARRIVDSLVADRFVDDLRYSSAYAREKSSISGWGPVKIRFQLRAKGIPEETLTLALAGTDPEKAFDKLLRTVREKDKTLQGDPQRKLKLLKFALGRGYNYDDVSRAVDTVMK